MAGQTSRVLHRSLRETPPKAIGGEGMWLIAEDGRRILDASGGAAVSCIGHQHPRVIEAMLKGEGPLRMGGPTLESVSRHPPALLRYASQCGPLPLPPGEAKTGGPADLRARPNTPSTFACWRW